MYFSSSLYKRDNFIIFLVSLLHIIQSLLIKFFFSLINLGPIGVAAAAAIVSAKKRKRPHSFETNPSIRKRQQNRLLRKLRVSYQIF